MYGNREVSSGSERCVQMRADHPRGVDGKDETVGGMKRRVWLEVALALVLVACLSLNASGASADPKDADHCIAPNGGVDLNEWFGVSEQIIHRFCRQADSGQRWTHSALWLMNTNFEAVPPDFVPAGATPLDDFLAKFVAVKYVIDPGTRQQRTHVDPLSDTLWIGIVADLPTVNTITLSSLHPLSVGQHVVEVYWVFNGMHCDGLGTNISQNCLLAGETLYVRTAFEVTPGHH